MLGPIAQAFVDLLDEQRGNVEVDVTVAQRLSPDQLEQVRQRVSHRTTAFRALAAACFGGAKG